MSSSNSEKQEVSSECIDDSHPDKTSSPSSMKMADNMADDEEIGVKNNLQSDIFVSCDAGSLATSSLNLSQASSHKVASKTVMQVARTITTAAKSTGQAQKKKSKLIKPRPQSFHLGPASNLRPKRNKINRTFFSEENYRSVSHSNSSSRSKRSSSSKTPAHESQPSNKKPKRPKEPRKPKKPKTAYNMYVKLTKRDVMKQNPHLDFQTSATEVGKQWRSLSSDQRQRYEDLAEQDKVRFKNDQQDYEQKLADYKQQLQAGSSVAITEPSSTSQSFQLTTAETRTEETSSLPIKHSTTEAQADSQQVQPQIPNLSHEALVSFIEKGFRSFQTSSDHDSISTANTDQTSSWEPFTDENGVLHEEPIYMRLLRSLYDTDEQSLQATEKKEQEDIKKEQN